MNVLVLGGTRFMGRRIAERLRDAGDAVSVLNRGTGAPVPGTRTLVGDRSQPDCFDVLGRERFDAVVDLSAYQSTWTRSAVDALAGRVGQYVFVSSGAVYAPSAELPLPETAACTGDPFWGAYAQEKVASERALWAAQEAGRFDVTILRLPFVLGPDNYADREAFVLGRLAAGRPIALPDGGQALNQHVHVDDVARAAVAALNAPDRSAGLAFNVGHRRGVTNAGFVALCADALGVKADVRSIDERAAGVATEVFDLADVVFPFPARHYLLDVDRLSRTLGVEARVGVRACVEDFVRWWSSRPRPSVIEYARERTALAYDDHDEED